jgi:metal-responsive CopG/Arc/MetJ family transcriptional regulator
MSRTKSAISTKRVTALRERRRAAGVSTVVTPLPVELIAEIDRIKEQRGVNGRAPIIEEALRFYIENAQRA